MDNLLHHLRNVVLCQTLPSKSTYEYLDSRTRRYVYDGYVTSAPNVEPCKIDDDCINGQICQNGVCTGLHMNHEPYVYHKNDYEDWLHLHSAEEHPESYYNIPHSTHSLDVYKYKFDIGHDYDYS